MQIEKQRRSQADRRAETRAALLSAARTLFIDRGYAETGTPELVKAANVTRGALYHHFADKTDLFRAVVKAEARAVAAAIGAEADATSTPLDAFMAGALAYFAAMKVPGRAALLLLEGPGVLGLNEMAEIDSETGRQTLVDGLRHAAEHGLLDTSLDPDALADLLSALFDRAALMISNGAPEQSYVKATKAVLQGLLKPD
ncbi:TetR/AcrR family transcriptional regulator [Roseibium sp. RKSG952]|uniref:TetR/AcrR family transcriptional regulator n=1 Tax=Roseibium sp. RKSG952 TaxID=2529384 RepID=UPI0012BBF560|nr:TetR/AcrR family transcriptional regulator [Roseibium sp. RKSG952]MTH97643.1 TetR/AcrR family transcriptional regulator [Roseibium sp. RKSG952]